MVEHPASVSSSGRQVEGVRAAHRAERVHHGDMGTSNDARDDLTVTHDAPGRRFEATTADGTAAGYVAYDPVPAKTPTGKDTMVVIHTVVQPEHEGQGVGSALARAALDHAREKKMVVIPECEFVRAFIERHEEYQSLLP